ncbi:MAG: hypothetical protein NWQ09_10065 [Nonlabens sp.]|nr:hypothetical protein [Nonlabens sp.]
METQSQQSNNGSNTLKIIIGALILALIALGAWTYSLQSANEGTVETMTNEKTEIQNELAMLRSDYDTEIAKGNELSDELIEARDRIIEMQKQISTLEPNVAALKNVRRELGVLKNERETLRARVAMLEKDNARLVVQVDSSNQVIISEKEYSKLVASKVDSLNTTVTSDRAKAGLLIPTNFSLKGMIIRSSGKEIENDKARRVDDLKVCFTLPTNAFAKTGVSSFYLQVINPDNNVLGLKKKVQLDSESLTYSKIVQFNYKGAELDICELVGADEDEIIKGNYRVNLYNGNKRVSSSELSLR